MGEIEIQISSFTCYEVTACLDSSSILIIFQTNTGFKPPRTVGQTTDAYISNWPQRAQHVLSPVASRGGTRTVRGSPVVRFAVGGPSGGKLRFPSRAEVQESVAPQRNIRIPVQFNNAESYNHVFSEVLFGRFFQSVFR